MGSMFEDIKLEPEWTSTVKPPIHYHEYQPDFDAEYAATKKFLEGKSYIKAPAPIRIIAIGGAASTLSFAREVQMGRIENAELVVYEKNAALAGTWFENRYPGCACDIPSHTYQYTWAPNPDWSSYYSGSAEIKEYFEKVAKKYDLEKYVQLRKKVIGAKWNEDTAMWDVEIEDLETGKTFKDSGNFFINGGGIINNWKWPNIKGLETFKGARMHSAAWDPEYDFKGKKVVVIGNGSSGVQITPVLQKSEYRKHRMISDEKTD
jgi:cation diffusion facilitator CzcD-associated flavoprotein CzcO